MKDRRIILLVIAVVLIGAVAWFVHKRTTAQQAVAARDQAQAAGRQVPVVEATVQKKDLPIFLDGLGSVTAFRTVTVRSPVEGLIDRVLFRAGE
jgi:multidrug efflux system membrane fusion protein